LFSLLFLHISVISMACQKQTKNLFTIWYLLSALFSTLDLASAHTTLLKSLWWKGPAAPF
jgi:hypothetical protein